MADPFSVTGTAVGIASLGIQVCQRLVQYYSQFRSYHDDIDTAMRRVEALQQILEAFYQVKDKITHGDGGVSAQLEKALNACSDGVRELEAITRKCAETRMPENLSDKARLVRKRLLWPFKKDSLSSIQVILDRLVSDLQLISSIMNIDIDNRLLAGLSMNSEYLIAKNREMLLQQSKQSTSLIHIQSELQDLSMSQTRHTTSIISTVSSEASHISAQLESITQKLSFLTTEAGHLRDPSRIPPSALNHASRDLATIRLPFKKSLRRYQKSVAKLSQCQCYSRHVNRTTSRPAGFLATLWQSDAEHLPDCPRYASGNFARVAEATFISYSRLLSFHVSVGFLYAQHAGRTTISPTLSYRAVLPRDSPTFQSFITGFGAHVSFEGPDVRTWSNREISKHTGNDLIKSALQELIQNFARGRSRPSDVDGDSGKTITHCALNLLGFFATHNSVDADVAYTFLDELLQTGVPIDEPDSHGWTPFDYLRQYLWDILDEDKSCSVISLVYSIFIQRMHSWEISRYQLSDRQVYDVIMGLFSVPENRYTFEHNGDLILLSVLQRDSNLLKRCLELDVYRTPYIPACLGFWPEGLRLFPLEKVDWDHDEHYALLANIFGSGDLSSLQYILDAGCRITTREWQIACSAQEKFPDSERDIIMSRLAARMAQTWSDIASKLPTSSRTPKDEYFRHPEFRELYHARLLTATAAESLWNNNFRCLDEEAAGLNSLWWQLSWLRMDSNYTFRVWRNEAKRMVALTTWFFEKPSGIQLNHLKLHTTPTHVLVRKLTHSELMTGEHLLIGMWYAGSRSMCPSLEDWVLAPMHDKCICPCSDHGCIPFTCAIQEALRRTPVDILDTPCQWPHTMGPSEIEGIAAKVRLQIYAVVEVHRYSHPWLSSSVLRVLTFHSLGLTHTCCYDIGDCTMIFPPVFPYNEKEICEIHYTESKDIDLLEHLVPEFEEGWKCYAGTFSDFIQNVWTPRMNELLRESSEIGEEEIESIREAGVVLKAFGPERPPGGG